MRIYLATMTTQLFTFDGYGATEDEAREALTNALQVHADEHGLLPGWVRETAGDAALSTYDLGHGYRDNEQIT